MFISYTDLTGGVVIINTRHVVFVQESEDLDATEIWMVGDKDCPSVIVDAPLDRILLDLNK